MVKEVCMEKMLADATENFTTGFMCSESVLEVLNRHYELGIGEEAIALSTGFPFSRFFSLKPRLFSQSFLSSPQKKRATVPGPVWLPIVVPMSLISTLPFSFGNRSSTRRATSRASSIQADWEI